MLETKEGANTYEHSLDHALEFFSKAGSLFEKRGSFYGGEESALSLFQKIWIVDKEIAFKLLLWLRDARGGAGNRSAFRSILTWLSENDGKDYIVSNLPWIVEVGRWDDFRSMFKTPMEKTAAGFWAEEIKKYNVLAAKWADRKDFAIKSALGIKKEGDFRKLLSKIRKEHIVEHKMSTNNWNEIEYEKVPSVAMSRYTNAFNKHDEKRFEDYKESLDSGTGKINASVLFPHDCVRTVRYGDGKIGNAQFEALPNYMEGVDERIIVISDTSASMGTTIGGSVQAIHVSIGMALYCSSRLAKNNPFYKKFIGFCSEGSFKNWNGMKFSEAINNRKIFDGAIGSTRIDKALNLILDTANFFNLDNNQIPTTLLIVSDMQFHQGAGSGNLTEVNACMRDWKNAGYNIPKIIYWNTAGYAGNVETKFAKNVALVSGFSPSILKSIFTGDDLTPVGVMMKTLEKYNIEIP